MTEITDNYKESSKREGLMITSRLYQIWRETILPNTIENGLSVQNKMSSSELKKLHACYWSFTTLMELVWALEL